MTQEQIEIGNWNVPKLRDVIEKLIGESYPIINISWCDESGKEFSRREIKDPQYLTFVTPEKPYLYEKIKALPGFLKIKRLNEIRSEGDEGFILVRKDETIFLKAIFTREVR